jgi:heat shock protein HslJ
MNHQERSFLDALGETRTWQVTGDTLILTGRAGQLARFAAQHMR